MITFNVPGYFPDSFDRLSDSTAKSKHSGNRKTYLGISRHKISLTKTRTGKQKLQYYALPHNIAEKCRYI